MDFDMERKDDWQKMKEIILNTDDDIYEGIIKHMTLRKAHNYKLKDNLLKRHPSMLFPHKRIKK
jgi:hypothetical protein